MIRQKWRPASGYSLFPALFYPGATFGLSTRKPPVPLGTGGFRASRKIEMPRHFRSEQVIESVSKVKIAFSLCDKKNSREGIFRGSLYGVFARSQSRSSIMRSIMGPRMISMAKPILPPGTTMVLRRDMKELGIILSR